MVVAAWLPGAGGTLPLLDPEGALEKQVTPERTLGCVVHSPNDMIEPAVIVHTGPIISSWASRTVRKRATAGCGRNV